MSGIYIHIPFCKQACHYCNFYFTTSKSNKDKLIDAICSEIEASADFLPSRDLKTIYFGGGTPSFIDLNDLKKIMSSIQSIYEIKNTEELTLEANPDDITLEKLAGWRDLGINRLSIGVQSFEDRELTLMNRSHQAAQAEKSILMAQDAGFNNISIDFIYGLPASTQESWTKNLEKAIKLGIKHLSCYSLTVKEKTKLMKMVDRGNIAMIDESLNIQQYQWMIEYLTSQGYEQYEISNFAAEQTYSVHNTNYWSEVPYLGIGPSAHSYDGQRRRWNIANNLNYIEGVTQDKEYFEEEWLTAENKYNEYILTKLRTKWGISPQR
ncbi:MAG: radical SAM family heme chaperone HemW [Bacteroidetes bacterium]|nr:radical SAM family heme chaperone HemW [Bacteroidota bacterium]